MASLARSSLVFAKMLLTVVVSVVVCLAPLEADESSDEVEELEDDDDSLAGVGQCLSAGELASGMLPMSFLCRLSFSRRFSWRLLNACNSSQASPPSLQALLIESI